MCGHLELSLQLGARQTTGLELTHPLRVAALRNLTRFLFLVFSLFHALGKAGFRVDEPFSGITHDVIIRIGWLPFTCPDPGRVPAVEQLIVTTLLSRPAPRLRQSLAEVSMAGPRDENLVDATELDDMRELEEDYASRDRHAPRGRADDAYEEIDPDSALSEVDRDDTVDD